MARILLIDDHSAICDLLVTALTISGHTVQVASDGAQGLQDFTTVRPDLVVTDLNLPACDGLEVIKLIKRMRPGVPVIVMSGGFGLHTSLYLDAAAEYGAAAVLRKPFHLATFLEAIDRALAGGCSAESGTEPFAAVPELAAV
jgi:DNA-binding NtrC family response regulator